MFATTLRGPSATIFVGLALVFTGTASHAQTTDSKFLACAGIADSLERLICYDEAVGALRATARQPAVPAPGTASRAPYRVNSGIASTELPTATTPVLSDRPRDLGNDATNEGRFPVYAMAQAGNDIAVQLQSGQIWRQIDGKDYDLPRDRDNLEAEITPAFQNSYFMTIYDGSTQRIRKMRVRRVK